MSESRNLTDLPLSAWGRNELEDEVRRLRETGGPCSNCHGKGKSRFGLGACKCCGGTGHRVKEVLNLYAALHNADRAYEETKQKADSHRRQRDDLLSKLETSSGRKKQ